MFHFKKKVTFVVEEYDSDIIYLIWKSKLYYQSGIAKNLEVFHTKS